MRSRIISLIAITSFFVPTFAQGQSIDSLQQQAQQAQQQAQQYHNLQKKEQQASQTFESQIENTQGEIDKVQSNIQDTQGKISDKQNNIQQTMSDIDSKQADLQRLQDEEDKAAIALWEMGTPSTIELVAAHKTLSEASDASENIQAFTDYLGGLVSQTNQIKHDLEDKKASLTKARDDLVNLQNQNQAQQQYLSDAKQQQADLKSQADQKAQSYSDLAYQAEQKQEQLEKQLAAAIAAAQKKGGGKADFVSQGHVHQGQVIGYEGMTGFATGPHVHFGLIRNGSYISAQPYVGSEFIWPLSSFFISQGFGPANWSNSLYTFHNGIDMVSNDGPGAPVMAAADGELIDPFHDNNCMPGGYGHYAAIQHANGDVTIYGHMIGNCH